MNKDTKGYVKELLFAVALTIITVKLQRAATSPDFFRTIKMKGALGVKNVALAQKKVWQGVEDMATTFYDIQRL